MARATKSRSTNKQSTKLGQIGPLSQIRFQVIAIMILGLAILSRASFAQVTIKERVSITLGGSVPAHLQSTEDLGLVTPRGGVLMILPLSALKTSSQLPPEEHLVITTHDTMYSVPMLPILPCVFQTEWDYYDTCAPGHPQYIVDVFGKWDFCETGLLDTFYVKNVAAGDTVRFFYHAEYNSPTMGLHQVNYPPPGDTTWQIQMYTYPPNVECYDPKPVLEGCTINVMFADTVLRFSRPPSDSVYPSYPGHDNTPSTRNYLDLELSTTFGDSFAPYAWVQVGRPTLVDSGGHSHDGARPLGRFIIQRPPQMNWDTVSTIEAQTDSTGMLKFRYLASQLGGREKVTACFVSDTTKMDTISILTIVKNLNPLIDGLNFDLVGGTCKHHGAGGGVCVTPDNNHYASKVVRDSLPLMSNVWVDSLKHGRLYINDISLPYGGLFDVSGNWRPEHTEHREGLDVDIRTEKPDRAGVKVRDSTGKWVGNAEFETLATRFGVKQAEGHKKGTDYEHYHLDY